MRPEDIENPETAASDAVSQLIAAQLAGFTVDNVPREIVIGSDLSTPRPTWSGPVYWYTTVAGGIPANAITGDSIFVYEQTATALVADYFTRADGRSDRHQSGTRRGPWSVPE